MVQARLVSAVRSGETSVPAASRAQGPAQQGSGTLPDGLTPREAEVLTLIAQGLTNPEICAQLMVSPATVKTHINRIFAKIGATDRAQAVGYAYRNNVVDSG
ncbi:response regulator transcription factor [Streptomyces sp. NPDC005408]|uniref:response regulator transcription factor n=1 Tax=Streptomyces sp. NPDC005408 TaxID=3155341 RepID=UPI0033BB45A5